MFAGRLRGSLRLLWRDFIMWASQATILLDEWMTAYLMADTGYQYVWSKLDVHRTLLKDDVRVEAFRKAIGETVKPGDRVLDVGTGTGILAFLACRAGAGEVVGIDSASIIDVAKKTAERNGMGNVRFVRSDLRDFDDGVFDCILCELIGMYVLDEGITYKMENARRLLRDDGKIMPYAIEIYVVPVESQDAGLGFWRELYGIDYAAVDKVPHEVRSYDMSGSRFLAEPAMMFTVDLAGETGRLEYEGEFRVDSDGQFHGCVIYFNAKLSESVTLTTHPKKPLTHWKQVFLPHDTRTNVVAGDTIKVKVKAMFRNTKWQWSYEVV